MTTLRSGNKTVTASKSSKRGHALITCHETGMPTTHVEVILAECRAHMARLYHAGWR